MDARINNYNALQVSEETSTSKEKVGLFYLMKTNVVMIRQMGQFNVLQRTSDGMFNATALLKQWGAFSGQQKKLDHFFENNNTQEFIAALIDEENLNTRNSVYLKSRGKYNGGTWMHPYLFIKFAMWLNPRFEVKVVKFVYDELIKHRHIAGDNFRLLTSTMASLGEVNYVQIAKALNWIVFNKHHKDIRNNATPEQLNELLQLESELSFAINNRLITSYAQLMETMRRIWNKKWCKF